MLLEAAAGKPALGVFLVENLISGPVSAEIAVSPLSGPAGEQAPSALRFSPTRSPSTRATRCSSRLRPRSTRRSNQGSATGRRSAFRVSPGFACLSSCAAGPTGRRGERTSRGRGGAAFRLGPARAARPHGRPRPASRRPAGLGRDVRSRGARDGSPPALGPSEVLPARSQFSRATTPPRRSASRGGFSRQPPPSS